MCAIVAGGACTGPDEPTPAGSAVTTPAATVASTPALTPSPSPETPVRLRGPAPSVTTVIPGDRGVVILEWADGPQNATRWQYRLRAAGADTASEWTDIPDAAAVARRYRVTGLPDGSTWFFNVRGVEGTLVGKRSELVRGETPTFDSSGTPRIPLWQQVSGGNHAWRVGATAVDIPAGMRVVVGVDPPAEPGRLYEQAFLFDTESESKLYVATDFGAECYRSISPSASGRDVGALFDRIIASARVTLDAPPVLTTVTTGDRGVVDLRWFGAPDEVTRWEYRLRGPYPLEGSLVRRAVGRMDGDRRK